MKNKLMKDMKFDDILNNRVDMERVDLVAIKPWISRRITGLITQEDEVLIDYIYNQLDPKYPDPKEIQTNLSGFLSFANARIFTAELWKQLMNSMEPDVGGKNEKQQATNDKIKSFPRLGPTESKQLKNKKIDRHYRSASSRSKSYSPRYYDRSRSRSNNRCDFKLSNRHIEKSRSRTKSSSRYTPYTRYSRYTDSYNSSSSSSHWEYNNRRTFYSSSSSSSSKSQLLSILKPGELNIFNYVTTPNFESKPPSIASIKDLEEIAMETIENISRSPTSVHFESSPVSSRGSSQDLSIQQYRESSSSSSDSVAFVSPKNPQLQLMSPISESSSSSEYSIEYMDKSLLLQCKEYLSDDEYESEVEWITKDEYQQLKDNMTISNSSLSSSPCDSYISSDYSYTDIEWIEEYQLTGLPDDYLRL